MPRNFISISGAGTRLGMGLMNSAAGLSAFLQETTGHEIIDMQVAQDLMMFVYRMNALSRHHRKGRYKIDDYGFDVEFTETLLPLLRLLYRNYWRVECSGAESVPKEGPALLVANHAGALPFDGAMIKVAVYDAWQRHVRALVAPWFGGLPGMSWMMRRTGQTLGHPDDASRLLGAGELVLVFPEGAAASGKLWKERYRLQRFGRGGFASIALAAGAPIIPVSVVGSEETYPMFADAVPAAKLLGLPYFPITATFPWLGPLGAIPLPSKWMITFHTPLETRNYGAESADDPQLVSSLAGEVRETIQAGIAENLMRRVRTFRG